MAGLGCLDARLHGARRTHGSRICRLDIRIRCPRPGRRFGPSDSREKYTRHILVVQNMPRRLEVAPRNHRTRRPSTRLYDDEKPVEVMPGSPSRRKSKKGPRFDDRYDSGHDDHHHSEYEDVHEWLLGKLDEDQPSRPSLRILTTGPRDADQELRRSQRPTRHQHGPAAAPDRMEPSRRPEFWIRLAEQGSEFLSESDGYYQCMSKCIRLALKILAHKRSDWAVCAFARDLGQTPQDAQVTANYFKGSEVRTPLLFPV